MSFPLHYKWKNWLRIAVLLILMSVLIRLVSETVIQLTDMKDVTEMEYDALGTKYTNSSVFGGRY